MTEPILRFAQVRNDFVVYSTGGGNIAQPVGKIEFYKGEWIYVHNSDIDAPWYLNLNDLLKIAEKISSL